MSVKDLVVQVAADVAEAIIRRMLEPGEHSSGLELVAARLHEKRALHDTAQAALDEENRR